MKREIKVEIIAVGTEILLGDIVNTNAQFLSRELANLGIYVYRQTVVGDNAQRILESFHEAFKRCDIIITSGGLGPTQDDITKEMAAKYFNKELILHQESLNKIEDYFKAKGGELTKGNRKQAYFPKDAIVLDNHNGTAPGAIIEGENNKVIIVLPGPPRELVPMFKEGVLPYLKQFSEGILYSKVLRIFGIGEGNMADKIKDILENQSNPTIAPYAKEMDVTLRITARAKDEEEAKLLIAPVEKKIRQRLGEDIYGEGDTTLENVVGEMLLNKKVTIATAESCTGGMLAARLINYPGISEVLMEGAVTYSNEAKVKRLGVKKETLDRFGAVSKETAKEMAEGIARTAGTDIGISVTGIAGPGGGTEEKPVGLVYVGLCIKGKTTVRKYNFQGNREKIRTRTVMNCLDWIRREVNKL